MLLLRPLNMALVFIAVPVGAALCGTLDIYIFIAAFSAVIILAGANALNDAIDAEIDKISHPKRPIPSGKVSRKSAIAIAIPLLAIGLILSLLLSIVHFLIALAAVILLIIYSIRLSAIALAGNITIAGVSALSIIYGALSVGVCDKTIYAAIIAGILHLAREVFKDIQDMPGDIATGRKTLPVIAGRNTTTYCASAISIAAIPAIVYPYIVGIYGNIFAILAIPPVILCVFSATFGIRKNEKSAQKLIKIAMATGMIALWAEAIFSA